MPSILMDRLRRPASELRCAFHYHTHRATLGRTLSCDSALTFANTQPVTAFREGASIPSDSRQSERRIQRQRTGYRWLLACNVSADIADIKVRCSWFRAL